jgi:surfeit locus 1 family protein
MSGRFRAPAWAWLLTAAAIAAFAGLGQWQLGKGFKKQAMLESLQDRATEPERIVAANAPPQGLEVRRAQARGTYLADQQLLLDGQSNQHRPGYRVWTPLIIDGVTALLVDRGWIPQDRVGLDGPVPAGPVAVTGAWRSLPRPGVRLEGTVNCPKQREFPAVVLYPTTDDLECLLGRPVIGGVLLLDPELPDGFVREWADLGFPPSRHYGYAVQWFALALAAGAIFFFVNRKRPA